MRYLCIALRLLPGYEIQIWNPEKSKTPTERERERRAEWVKRGKTNCTRSASVDIQNKRDWTMDNGHPLFTLLLLPHFPKGL